MVTVLIAATAFVLSFRPRYGIVTRVVLGGMATLVAASAVDRRSDGLAVAASLALAIGTTTLLVATLRGGRPRA
ncbi:MAG: hypothetical protein NVSMB19_06860 [Vulcanimicrobiaceae bacterium]